MNRRRLSIASAVGIVTLLLGPGGTATAQPAWPTKPIVLISPYAPGGTTDVLARLLASRLQTQLGQRVLVENRPGAGGNLGTDYVAKAKPDGYTFLVGSSGPIVISGALYPKLPYDSAKDFTPITSLAKAPFVLAVNAKAGLNSLQDVIAQGKTGRLNYGSAGSGTPQHIIGEMFNLAAGTKIQHVPYKGSAPLLTDLVGGQVPMSFDNPVPMMQQVKAGNIKVLAVTSATRSPAFPEVPTLAEGGLKDFNAEPWYGMLAPAGLPEPIASRMNAEVQAILKSPEVQDQLKALGAEAMPMSPGEFRSLIAREIAKWAQAVKASGATVD